ncbi:hypothetical protein Cob_v001833 [Colletotrichum orbiculare MAFF 240422]|uniref:Uncharacterized protein n=1 Tax=Colletotrichum orbiculare (strain 104-T / ATCC 96160 / CBS 514.97 / LARS 414 / MAFF 240422) TaxID=1213857 RepID=A0A484G6Q0_COLOR|nr:hypothetical protein Cob_v001833 [Colletotrichum orbiculare MAFF 240422]
MDGNGVSPRNITFTSRGRNPFSLLQPISILQRNIVHPFVPRALFRGLLNVGAVAKAKASVVEKPEILEDYEYQIKLLAFYLRPSAVLAGVAIKVPCGAEVLVGLDFLTWQYPPLLSPTNS